MRLAEARVNIGMPLYATYAASSWRLLLCSVTQELASLPALNDDERASLRLVP